MMIKSAFMTTASQVRNDGSGIAGGPFAIGAGHVVPNSALDPGLVYDAGWNDWLAFLCGTGNISSATCATLQGMGYSLDPRDLNYPSIGVGALAGAQTVRRSVTNVGGSAATYASSVTAPSGITVAVSPASLFLQPGETKAYTVTFASTPTAGFNTYAIGALTWTDGTHNVRSPIAVRPVALAAPASWRSLRPPSRSPARQGQSTSPSRGWLPRSISAASCMPALPRCRARRSSGSTFRKTSRHSTPTGAATRPSRCLLPPEYVRGTPRGTLIFALSY